MTVATLATAIGSDFGASSLSSWVGTSYLLCTTCFSPFYGRLADIIGRRYTITLALMIFSECCFVVVLYLIKQLSVRPSVPSRQVWEC